MRTTNISG